ncbi:cyclopropane-fatty-acyl-phospholipid synthase [Xylariales sp. AK1849]|nr:cyclopropane-fatty-acyl-phospholipid synthase [Xylariales sp. AK1849]
MTQVLASIKSAYENSLQQLKALARYLVLSRQPELNVGFIEIKEPDGNIIERGKRQSPEKSQNGGTPRQFYASGRLTIHSDFVWVRLLLAGEMGLAEAYMLGEVSSPDLTSFLQIFALRANRPVTAWAHSSAADKLSVLLNTVFGRVNNVATARLNAVSHYSASNDIFAAFLDPTMTYSCPIWLPATDPAAETETLEETQKRKLRNVVSAALIKSTDHVLEIGSGWGSFALLAVAETGCRVTTITLSAEQKQLIEQRIKVAGFSDRIQVLQCDYREVPYDEPFDKVVSIEMLEHVGHQFLETYFENVNRYLKPIGGIGVFQSITMNEPGYAEYIRKDDFFKRYIFPGGELPSVSALVSGIQKGAKGQLVIEDIRGIPVGYIKALRLWREKFLENFETIIAPELRRKHPGMSRDDVEIFKNKWVYYFCRYEAAFKSKSVGDVVITVSRDGCVELLAGYNQ